MSTLYSYCIPYDDGAAPNPYGGVCTLAICKPRIRSTAKKGDWVVGTGSINAPTGDLSNKVVYAMRITEIKTMQEYFEWAKNKCHEKIPDLINAKLELKLGDAIYDFSSGQPVQLPSVHNESNIESDLSGKNVLLSDEFYFLALIQL